MSMTTWSTARAITTSSRRQNTLGESGDSNEASAVPNIPPDAVVTALHGAGRGRGGRDDRGVRHDQEPGQRERGSLVARFYLSDNSALDPADVLLSGVQLVPALRRVRPASRRFDRDSRWDGDGTPLRDRESGRPGRAVRDQRNEQHRSRSVQVGPDLDVSSFTVPSEVAAGGTISVTDTVTNVGGSASPGAFAVTFYLSANYNLDGTDTLLPGSRAVSSLAAGASSAGAAERHDSSRHAGSAPISCSRRRTGSTQIARGAARTTTRRRGRSRSAAISSCRR